MKSIIKKTLMFLGIITIMVSQSKGIKANMTKSTVQLPKTVGAWTRPDKPRIIETNTIFNYMNGGGELYLAYRFSHIEVFEYQADQGNTILVEIYFMKTSEDAFGLLSLDWGGEPEFLHGFSELPPDSPRAPNSRALFGEGLLRLCSGNIFARVLAYRNTPESKKTVLSIGRSIAEKYPPSLEPDFLKVLPETIDSNWKLRKERISYFRSHLVLNSIYYLSHENILDLDHSTEALVSVFENKSSKDKVKRIQTVCVKYSDAAKSQKALNHFLNTYISEQKPDATLTQSNKSSNFVRIEDGWLGYKRDGRCLVLAFEAPDQQSAQAIVQSISCNQINR